MIKHLYIKNFALIEEISIDFESGFNVITGETGAGKSIIIDALNIALGSRASNELIKKGQNKAIVEVTFELNSNHKLFEYLKNKEIESNEGSVILRRELNLKANSRCFINDSLVSLAELENVGDMLVDFHGQHQHQSLLKAENHLEIFDANWEYQNELREYANAYNDFNNMTKELIELEEKERDLIIREEFLEFQLAEINKTAPKEDEYDELEEELKKLENFETISNITNEINAVLNEKDNSILGQLKQVQKKLDELNKFTSDYNDYNEEFIKSSIAIKELDDFNRNFLSSLEYKPAKAEQIRVRLGELNLLRKKYGSYEEIFTNYEKLNNELNEISSFSNKIDKLKDEISDIKQNCIAKAKNLSLKRNNKLKKFDELILKSLKNVGLENAIFKTNINQIIATSEGDFRNFKDSGNKLKLTTNGIDKLEFYISTNKGETLKPLKDIASGGEISRVMLAIKSITSENDAITSLIFDEIDNGISGRVASMVASEMLRIAENKQIIAISHLPQIAAKGNNNYVVQKKEAKAGVKTEIVKLNTKEKVEEIAKLISGDKVSKESLQNAEILIKT